MTSCCLYLSIQIHRAPIRHRRARRLSISRVQSIDRSCSSWVRDMVAVGRVVDTAADYTAGHIAADRIEVAGAVDTGAADIVAVDTGAAGVAVPQREAAARIVAVGGCRMPVVASADHIAAAGGCRTAAAARVPRTAVAVECRTAVHHTAAVGWAARKVFAGWVVRRVAPRVGCSAHLKGWRHTRDKTSTRRQFHGYRIYIS